jgi:hypothetical protein
VPLFLYAVVVLSGATFSSLGVDQLRQDPQHPMGTTWGNPNYIRSDEFLTLTAVELNVMSLGHSSHSPLAESPDITFMVSSGQPFESLLFLENNLLRLGPWLPDDQLFAAVRALPFLVLALTLPPLLRRIGGVTRPLSWLGYGLVVAAPTSVWWSFTPLRVAAIASLGAYLLALARDRLVAASSRRQRVLALVLAGLGGISLARLATYYVPWCLTIGLPIVVAVVLWLVVGRPRRAGWQVLGVGAVVGGVVLAMTFWENRDAVRATLDTVYPGVRRSTGEALDPYQVLGTPGLWLLHHGVPVPPANGSGVASAFLVCALWAVLVLALRRRLDGPPEQKAALWGLGGSVAVWLSWCTISWGGLGMHVPLLNLVPAFRVSETVGYAASLFLVVVLSRAGRLGWVAAGVAALGCLLATAYGVHNLRVVLPDDVSTTAIWLTAGVVGVCVLAVSRWPRWFTVLPLCLLLVWPVWFVNPVQLGLGDLRASEGAAAARALGERARADGTLVTSDSPFVSMLLVSSGVPTLSGWQISGPDRDTWRLLDPGDTQEEAWNRGASYLVTGFGGAPGAPPQIVAGALDQVVVVLDPCGIPADLHVALLITQTPDAPAACLELDSTFMWAGATQYVYRVTSR